jgi:hypothetical protein
MIKIKNTIFKFGVQAAIFFLVAQIAAWIIFIRKLPPQIPLFYSRPWGEKQLANPFFLLILPALSLIVLLTNTILASIMSQENKLVNQLLVIAAALFSLLCLTTLLKIVTLVT